MPSNTMLKAMLIGILCSIQHSTLVFSSTSTVTCQDSYECKDETLEGTYIKCYGYYACENATMSGTYSYNYGYLAAYSSHQSVPYTFSSGLYSMLDSEVETTTSKVYGYLGAAYVEYSAYSTSLSISLMGYLAGYSSDVVCSSGEACRYEKVKTKTKQSNKETKQQKYLFVCLFVCLFVL